MMIVMMAAFCHGCLIVVIMVEKKCCDGEGGDDGCDGDIIHVPTTSASEPPNCIYDSSILLVNIISSEDSVVLLECLASGISSSPLELEKLFSSCSEISLFALPQEPSSSPLARILGASTTTLNCIRLSSTSDFCFSSVVLDFVSLLEVSLSGASSTSIHEL
jgi:hypothetical protein